MRCIFICREATFSEHFVISSVLIKDTTITKIYADISIFLTMRMKSIDDFKNISKKPTFIGKRLVLFINIDMIHVIKFTCKQSLCEIIYLIRNIYNT